MAKYLVCVSDERHASYEIERAILEKAGAELKLANALFSQNQRAELKFSSAGSSTARL